MNKKNRGLYRQSIIFFIIPVFAHFIFILTGCYGGGASGDSLGAPSTLTYTTTSAVYTTNLKIAENIPKYTGNAEDWGVEPSLPDGLVIDSNTGVISGTPVKEQQAKEYTVTASNSSGKTTTVISITVNNEPPSALSYSVTSAVYTKDVPIPENKPTVTGTITLWSVSPSLPDGLVMDPSTGIISGTPVKEQSAEYYTVTATNSGGLTTASISIVINSKAPSDLSYSNAAAVYTKDVAIAENKPSISGTANSWSITPELPDGLSIDPSTGIISGTPRELISETDYTVKAVNSGGETTIVIKITVNDLAPSGLSYSNQTAVYTVGAVIADNKPTVSGSVTTWSVTPALPHGLTLNTTTGVISGIPSIEQSSKVYTVKAANTGGSTSVDITITVNYEAPTGLTYSIKSAVYTVGKAITVNKPSVTGTVTSWSVAPDLPKGLILNTTTGEITGTPEVVQAEKSYTITATNSGGSISTTITIQVNGVPPSGLAYNPSTCTLGKKLQIFGNWHYLPSEINLVPQYTGTVTSWSINKTLPSGITINISTGVISGQGLAGAGSSTSYTITASNSYGSISSVIIIKGP